MVYPLVSPTLAAESGRGRRQSHGGHGVSGGTRLRLHRKLETERHMFMPTHAHTHVACSCARVRAPSGGGTRVGVSSGSRRPAFTAYVQAGQPPPLSSPANFCPALIFLGLVAWGGSLGSLVVARPLFFPLEEVRGSLQMQSM